ncbi:hypothetical protein SAMN06295974_2015 [Plantibacter flavus]|uniref:Uncharacterized protein n=1 Tax=Plantibacter flavus TaxID=150123 RepID=A0A3N2BXZ5_9MICO|nr:hypothetical protein [Plantibacter flavus]ROR80119.1 hypothetical protein EDD42_0152 [Plantibacter flavus]SMG29426.1 hypothetical protein SAMN06295974_2015 [Plantibacter flavus]
MSKPNRDDVLRPIELLVLSGVMGVFTGVVVLMSTREIILSLIGLGIAFIASLVVLAMLALAVKPDFQEKLDLDEQDGDDKRPPRPSGH